VQPTSTTAPRYLSAGFMNEADCTELKTCALGAGTAAVAILDLDGYDLHVNKSQLRIFTDHRDIHKKINKKDK
jgi:hypothetical protein